MLNFIRTTGVGFLFIPFLFFFNPASAQKGTVLGWSMVAKNGSTISLNHLPDTIIMMRDDPEINLWQNISSNINCQHTFKPGKILYFDVNYIYYKDHNPNTYYSDYYGQENKYLYHENLRGDKSTPIHFQVYSTDYKTPLGKKVSMEAGLKLAVSDFTNEASVDYFNLGVWTPVSNLTAKYLLEENISAAYASFRLTRAAKLPCLLVYGMSIPHPVLVLRKR
jgi:Outer membrane protein beta-barrel family